MTPGATCEDATCWKDVIHSLNKQQAELSPLRSVIESLIEQRLKRTREGDYDTAYALSKKIDKAFDQYDSALLDSHKREAG